MNIELTGTLKVIYQTEKLTDALSKKEIVVTVDENTPYPQDILCQALNKRIDLLTAEFKMGDRVTVKCNLNGKEKNGKYYNQVLLWDIRKS